MGIKHLVKIENYFKRYKDKSFYRVIFVKKGISYDTVLEVIDLLLKQGKIIKIKEKHEVKYQWVQK